MKTLDGTYTGVLVVMNCPTSGCGVAYGLDERFQKERRQDHNTWYCPNGHSLHYPQKNDLEREREARIHAEARAARMEDRAEMERRSTIAYKGHLTRARKKIAMGECPVPECKQHFSNVREHMRHKHPDYGFFDPVTGKSYPV